MDLKIRPVAGGEFPSLLDAGGAAKVLPDAYERARLAPPGALTRSAAWWEVHLRDVEPWRDGASARFCVAHEAEAGPVGGYASYRVKWDDGPGSTLLVDELVAATPESHAALWRYLCEVDLVATVRAGNCPVDDPLPWMLADPRQARVTKVRDWLWARLVDVPAALAARRYRAEGAVVLDVVDAFRPRQSGRYRLDAGPDGAACRPTTEAADLVLDASALGAAYLGDVPLAVLARAGRVDEATPGAIARADAAFASDPAPWCATPF